MKEKKSRCPPSIRKKLGALPPCCSLKYMRRKYNYCWSSNKPHWIMGASGPSRPQRDFFYTTCRDMCPSNSVARWKWYQWSERRKWSNAERGLAWKNDVIQTVPRQSGLFRAFSGNTTRINPCWLRLYGCHLVFFDSYIENIALEKKQRNLFLVTYYMEQWNGFATTRQPEAGGRLENHVKLKPKAS